MDGKYYRHKNHREVCVSILFIDQFLAIPIYISLKTPEKLLVFCFQDTEREYWVKMGVACIIKNYRNQ